MMKHWTRRLLATTSAMILALPAYAGAQNARPASGSADPQEATTATIGVPNSQGTEGAASADGSPSVEGGDIVVTGSNIRGVKPIGSQSVSVGREDLKQAGVNTPSDLARIVPQLQPSSFNEGSATNNNTRGASFNLRGLGSNATLTLINGRRYVPSGGTTSFNDANIVPIQALERIEIVADGASAIYGADAVGGVVNFILRKDFAGFEAAGRYFNQLGQDRVELSGVGGVNFELGGRRGNVIGTVTWSKRNGLPRTASRFLRGDLTPFGGLNANINGQTVFANPRGVIAAPSTGGAFDYYSVNANGTSVTPGLANLAADVDNYDFLLPERTTRATLIYTQELSSSVEFSLTGVLSEREDDQRQAQFVGFTVPSTSPFFIPGIPGTTTSQRVSTRYRDAVGRLTERSYLITPALSAKLFSDWHADAYLTAGLSEGCGLCRTSVSTLAPSLQVSAGVLNPFATQFSDAFYAANSGEDEDSNRSNFTDFVGKVNGSLFSLPGGAVRAAIGTEITSTDLRYVNANPNTADASRQVVTNSNRRRRVDSFFGELFVPLLNEEMGVPAIRNLAVSGAVRHDRYTDFGKTTNPKIGVTWEVVEGLSLRGSWGTSFRAPTLQEAATDSGTTIFDVDFNLTGNPLLPADPTTGLSTFAYQVRGTPLSGIPLQPEKAKTYSLGADFEPRFLPGLRVSGTYYNVDYTDRIAFGLDIASQYYASPAAAAAFANYITPAVQPATCNNNDPSTFGALYQQAFQTAPFNSFVPADYCSAVGIVYTGNINFGKVVQNGLDVTGSYQIAAGAADINLGVNWNHIFGIKQTVLPNTPTQDVVATITYPVRDRFRATAAVSLGPVNLGIFGNYVGPYLNNLPNASATTTRIPSWFTTDVNLGVKLPRFASFSKEARLSVTVNNVFDRDPPVVLSQNAAYDARNANVYGRTVQVELLTRF